MCEALLLPGSRPQGQLVGEGGRPEKLIAALVNRVVDDAAGDLEWKN